MNDEHLVPEHEPEEDGSEELIELRLLNAAPDTFLSLFESQPPAHLGIGILVMIPPDTKADLVAAHYYNAVFAAKLLNVMSEIAELKREFFQHGIEKISASASLAVEPEALRMMTPDSGPSLEIVFFDADHGLPTDRWADAVIGTAALRTHADAVDSYEIGPYMPLHAEPEFAELYYSAVGDLFSSGQAFWSGDLARLHDVLRCGIRAFIKDKPVVETMRKAQAIGASISEFEAAI